MSEEEVFPAKIYSIEKVSGVAEVSYDSFAGMAINKNDNPERFAIESTMHDAINDVLSGFDERQQIVIKRRFWENKTLLECAEELGVGKERVRQIEARVLHDIRRSKKGQALGVFLDMQE